MTEHGGERDPDRNSADSWFRPSQNRHRTQSEYQDPLDEQREEEDQGTVFPDSGGYAGLGSARPEMVEPYPEALGGFTPAEPQTPSVPEEPVPSTSYESQNPFVYPGAGEAPHRPVEPMPWEDHDDRPGGYPNVAASADVPAPPGETGAGEWPSTGSVDHDASPAAADTWALDETAPDTGHWNSPEAWTPGTGGHPAAETWSPSPEPSSWNNSEAGAWGTGPPPSDREPRTPSGVDSSWGASDVDSLAAGPSSSGLGDSWSSSGGSSSWDVPESDSLGAGAPSYGGESWASSGVDSSWGASDVDSLAAGPSSSGLGDSWSSSGGSSSWDVPESDSLGAGAPSYGGESWSPSGVDPSWESSGVDPIGPGASAPVNGEHRPPADNTSSWEPSSEETPMGSAGPSGRLGSWGAPGTDPLGPRTPAPGEPWPPAGEPSSLDTAATGDVGGWNTSDRPEYGEDGYGDELSGTAGPGSWTPGDRASFEEGWSTGNDRPWADDGYDDELSGTRPPEPEQPGDLSTGSGNTWAFSRDDPRLPDAVRQAEQRRHEDADGGARHDDWGGPGDPGHGPAPVSDDPLAALADLQSRVGAEAEPETAPPVGDDQGASTQMFSPLSPDGLGDETARPPAGVSSDLGSVPSYGRRADEGQWEDGYDDEHAEYQDAHGDYEEEYDDGFTPADYGMSEKPRRGQRRRLDISEDFPGFDDRPLGGEPGDGYPGYDSVDFLADTEPGANLTLWLGAASLIPFVGVITALLALLVTGPKAKREIRDSRGELDGHGRIMTGTVLAVIGIVVTVISLAITLIL